MRADGEARLAAFEKMLADVQQTCDELTLRMDRLKAEGKEKSATFRQYWSNRMTCQYLLTMYRQYGLIENDQEGDKA